jgi:hypothetical protein
MTLKKKLLAVLATLILIDILTPWNDLTLALMFLTTGTVSFNTPMSQLSAVIMICTYERIGYFVETYLLPLIKK